MAAAKKLDKIIDEFYDVYDKYQEAYQSNDRKGVLKYGRQLFSYLSEHRKALEISDEYINELNTALLNLEQTIGKMRSQKKSQTLDAYFITEAEKQDYFRALLRKLPMGRGRTEH